MTLRYVTFGLSLIATGAVAQSSGSTTVPRSLFIQSMDQEFGKMDADKDGSVTRAEVENFQRVVAVANAAARARGLFARLDSDRNGQLSYVEFAKTQNGPPQVNGQPLVAQLDANKDGRISLVEHRAGKLIRFDQVDTDKDGVVTAAEMRASGTDK